MWFVGLLLGLLVGAALESVVAALIFGIVGALALPPLWRKINAATNGDAERIDGPRVFQSTDVAEGNVVQALRRELATLTLRVHTLELMAGIAAPAAEAEAPAEADGFAETSPPLPVEAPPLVPPRVLTPQSPSGAPAVPPPLPAIAPGMASLSIATGLEPSDEPPSLPESTFSPAPAPAPSPWPTSTPAGVVWRAQPVDPLVPRAPAVPLRDRLPAPLRNLIFGGNMLVKAGVLILFLGLAFLLRYTAERVTVPIELRYAMVALVGAGLLGIGWFLRNRRKVYALTLQGAGIGVFYLTTLAAMKLNALLPPTAGFGFLFAVAVLSAMLAVLQDAPLLALVAALEGFAAPVLASTGGNHPVALFTYLLVLDVGIFLIAWFKAWRPLNLIGLVGTFTLAAGWAHANYTDDQYGTVQPFLVVFFLMFSVIGLLFARRTLADSIDEEGSSLAERAASTLRRVGRVDSSLVFGVPMVAFALQYLLMRPWEFGAAFSALALGAFYLAMGRFVFATQPRGLALLAEAYAVVGVIFATLAIPLGLEGQWTGATWAVEAAGMYWLGIRQQRPYARAFSFVLVIGAVVQMLRAVTVVATLADPYDSPLFHGSFIGPLMMAAGVFSMWTLLRRARLDSGSHWEALAGSVLPWIGIGSLTLLPWQTLYPANAAAATALMAVATFVVAVRLGLAPLRAIVHAMQLLSVLAFIATLHGGHVDAEGGPVPSALGGGIQAMLDAALIALCVLGTSAWSMRQAHRAALTTGIPPDRSLTQTVGLLVGVGLIHLAMLFGIDLGMAALIWPVTALVVLWVALRVAHGPLAILATALHVIAALLFLSGNLLAYVFDGNSHLTPFANIAFWTPLALGLTALVAGDWLRNEARFVASGEAASAAKRWPNHWCASPWALWPPVGWGLFWWLSAMLGETIRVRSTSAVPAIPAAVIGVLLATSALASLVAARRDWRQLGQATIFTLPALGLMACFAAALHYGAYLPSAAYGWLAWPLALAWHLRLLRSQQRWLTPRLLGPLHVAGLWLFLLLAARECQLQFTRFGDDYSSWPLLGWVLVPALVLWALRSRAVLQRWPLVEYRRAYLDVALAPVAAYLFVWCWVSNVLSPGDAAPLPYVPLLNPLELAHAMLLVAIALWWKALSPDSVMRAPPNGVKGIAAVTGWALLTGIVLRSCHHYLGVPWEADALYASWPTQAAISLVWAVCGVVAMVLGHARASRPVWIGGAVLLGIVVVKLFFVELADQGGLFRIVSFIGVGALLLLVGYFAPVPPAGASPLKESTA